jgi:hypothetical protein
VTVDAPGEHMHRTCPFCSYEWAEATRTPAVVDLTQEDETADTTG